MDGQFHDLYIINHKHFYCPLPLGYEDMYFELPELIPLDDDESLLDQQDNEIMQQIQRILNHCQPYPGDDTVITAVDPTFYENESRFFLEKVEDNFLSVYDRLREFDAHLTWNVAKWDEFSLGKWFAERCALENESSTPSKDADEWMRNRQWCETTLAGESTGYWMENRDDSDPSTGDSDSDDDDSFDDCGDPDPDNDWDEDDMEGALFTCGIQVDRNAYVSVQRNAAKVKGLTDRMLPKPVVLRVGINGNPVRALVDSGSLGDFISSTLVDQLKVNRHVFEKSIGLQLAVQGSRSKINAMVFVQLTYQGVNESRQLDVINLNDYDVILGTPWIYQHQVCIGLNPARIVIGSDIALPIAADKDVKPLLHTIVPEIAISAARDDLMAYADPLCRNVDETDLPPLRAINHTIPLIDDKKTYQWRASRCPEIFRDQWAAKRDAYLKSGRWRMTSARNTVPMLLIPKPHKPKNAQELRTVIDLRWSSSLLHRIT